ncbi:MAG: hypothetical protein A2096_17870 [Spirochaetes bacterium GWF1_41_5]|nr:MAG: hypothetical protein A2096_17870 [Spirochaetes bacterium GWF1_41_5]HBE01657.1 hypothetical protein [Spirochaetia bacterium]
MKFSSRLFLPVITGVKEIYYHKLRSFLTMLGIILGVSSLISMISIINGAKQNAVKIMNEQGGLNKVTVKFTDDNMIENTVGVYKYEKLSIEDVDELVTKHSDIIKAVSPELSVHGHAKRGSKQVFLREVTGCLPSYILVNQYDVSEGRMLCALDDLSCARVCVIGNIIKEELFAEKNPLGETIEISGIPFRIIGVFSNYQMKNINFGIDQRQLSGPSMPGSGENSRQKKSTAGNRFTAFAKNKIQVPQYAIDFSAKKEEARGAEAGGGPPGMAKGGRPFFMKYAENNALWQKNLTVVIPFTTMRILFKDNKYIDTLNILLQETINLNASIAEMKNTLKARRMGNELFEFTTQAEKFEMMNKQLEMFNIVLGAIAAISLVVGGIGIMNIILASINERIREIGVRKSVGATDFDIFIQFLIETMILSFIGGVFGVMISVFTVQAISIFSGFSAVITSSSVFLAMSFSIITGLVFGIYPSIKAAGLNPIAALRYE